MCVTRSIEGEEGAMEAEEEESEMEAVEDADGEEERPKMAAMSMAEYAERSFPFRNR